MRAINFAIVMLVIMMSLVSAETLIPEGTVSGIWDSLNSPYIIQGNINIPINDSLIIMPGTIVQFDSVFNLDAYGSLKAQGNLANQVIISGNNNQINLHTPSSFNYSNIYLPIIGTGSSGNQITNSIIQKIYGGNDWYISNDSVIYSKIDSTSSNETLRVVCIENASGIFEYINLDLSVTNLGGVTYAGGFVNCSGLFSHNLLQIRAEPDSNNFGWSDSIGIGMSMCTGLIERCRFDCESGGVSDFSGIIRNCTFINSDWRAINDVVPPGYVENCIIYNSKVAANGHVGHIYVVKYTDVYGCNYLCNGFVTIGPGCAIWNPGFFDTWNLKPGSYCINRGNPTTFDPDCTIADMGAMHFPFEPTGVCPEYLLVEEPIQLQSYPNPFNTTTNLNYKLTTSGMTNLSIYDLSGRLVKNIINGYKELGEYSIKLNGNELSTGIYFCILKQGNSKRINKLVIIK